MPTPIAMTAPTIIVSGQITARTPRQRGDDEHRQHAPALDMPPSGQLLLQRAAAGDVVDLGEDHAGQQVPRRRHEHDRDGHADEHPLAEAC